MWFSAAVASQGDVAHGNGKEKEIGEMAEAKTIAVPELQVRRVILSVEGTSPLIVNAWSRKGKESNVGQADEEGRHGQRGQGP